MQERTPAEVGELLRRRREMLGLTQHTVPNVSSATVGKIERAAADRFRPATLTSYLHALGLKVDAWDRLMAGEAVEDLQATEAAARPTGLDERLAAIERRLTALEGAPSLEASHAPVRGLRVVADDDEDDVSLPAHEDPDEFPEAAHRPDDPSGGSGSSSGAWARPPVGLSPAEDGDAIDEGVDPPAPDDDFDQGDPGDGA